MKRTLFYMLMGVTTLSMMLSGCGKESTGDAAENSNAEYDANAAENSENSDSAGGENGQDSDKEDPETTKAQQTENGKIATIITHKVTSTVDGKEWGNGVYPEIVLSDEYAGQYPKLAEYIRNQNNDWANQLPSTVAEYASYAMNDTFYDDPLFSSEINAHIVRADDRLFTMTVNYYDWAGGAHPNHYTSSINVDPVTGSEVRLDQILGDSSKLSEAIRTKLSENYPDILDEVDSFYFQDEGDDPDQFVDKLKKNSYTFTVTDTGLYIVFSPYEIASYAAGYLEVLLTPDEYPGLVQKAYLMDEAQDMEKLVDTREGDTIEVEPQERTFDSDVSYIENPTWDAYVSTSVTDSAAETIKLSKVSEEKTDWINLEVWSSEHGVETASPFHEDDVFEYIPYNPVGYSYMYTGLQVYEKDGQNLIYDLNLESLCNGPDNRDNDTSDTNQFIRYELTVDNILYVEIGHNEYSSNEMNSNYIVAIDLDTKEVLFRSEPLVANAGNFLIADDCIICGYGFTAEPDYIYILDRFTGERLEAIKVNSAPEQFEMVDDTLYVATYNTAYTYKIGR